MFRYLKKTKAVHVVEDDHVIPVDGLQCQKLEINHKFTTYHQMLFPCLNVIELDTLHDTWQSARLATTVTSSSCIWLLP
jgi:hypothetical protein